MQALVMLFSVAVVLMCQCVYSLPAINYTDNDAPNEIMKTLSEAPAEQQQQQLVGQVDPRGKRRGMHRHRHSHSRLQASTTRINIRVLTGTTSPIYGLPLPAVSLM